MVKKTLNKAVQCIEPLIIAHIQNIWGTLEERFLSVPREDFHLKYPSSFIPGEWTMLCIIDTLPDTPNSLPTNQGWIGRDTTGKVLEIGVGNIILRLRQLFGRPSESYGVTPLMIFREITRR